MALVNDMPLENNEYLESEWKKDNRCYLAIDLKSFYASVECRERGLDPLNTNLVVADATRTEKTICLAVSPSLKAYGIPGRARLFEVIAKLKEVNAKRKIYCPNGNFIGESFISTELAEKPELAVGYIAAPPRMALYMEYSTRIFQIYLKYVSMEDIHPYSIDEVFMDVTDYLSLFHKTPREFAQMILADVLNETGITATAGIGTNLYLCKVAMDVWAKHIKPDQNGARIAELDELSFRKNLWNHTPLTDFWRIGKGTQKKLNEVGIYTLGDVARCSIGKQEDFHNEDLLYRLFGINAELLIDHAWGYEPCVISEIKAYRPESSSISSGQVLKEPYSFEKARIVIREMTEMLVLDLVSKKLLTDQLVINIGYDVENVKNPDIVKAYGGTFSTDHYGRVIPKHAHGTTNLDGFSSSTDLIVEAVLKLYDSIVNPILYIRRLNVTANHTIYADDPSSQNRGRQLNLFADYEMGRNSNTILPKDRTAEEKEKKRQQAVLAIKEKYGKNAILKGTDFLEGATARERNGQIGGHKA